MSTATTSRKVPETLAEALHRLGDVPLERIRFHPYPGTATVKDVIAARESPERRLCELVDGVLVEKTMGAPESYLAVQLSHKINSYLDENDLGFVLGPDGTLRILPHLVRIPDVSFISWDQLPEREVPDQAVPRLVPGLAVEVLSPGNTPAEMLRKLRDYFEAGVRLVWFIDPKTQSATVYTSPADSKRIGKTQSLDGGDVLPGFRLPLKTLFERTKKGRGGK